IGPVRRRFRHETTASSAKTVARPSDAAVPGSVPARLRAHELLIAVPRPGVPCRSRAGSPHAPRGRRAGVMARTETRISPGPLTCVGRDRMARRESAGALMAIGGAEDKLGGKEILSEFVRLSGGPEESRIVVMPVASTVPEEQDEQYREV